ncbi:unnamed protein product [Rotaria sp. Silwood1]|nr:unnamed protein product [Rotaria sp. Silwood1]CAF0745743.1 unnamed protein product [Rotaria sp. Silwood1]CAF3335234.1 unnamed protein product [Rotaria sp. Silwood1]CAF3351523.1 unnamed protein product [Rotaria sp. Silwood1]CAF4622968.1 unnamed protein product [Rotaria sp. Silwood1]
MATRNITKISRSSSWPFQSSTDLLSNETCWFISLPSEILQIIIDFLSIKDIISLCQTCQTFYTLLNDNNFWTHRIHRYFPHSIASLYTIDLFQKPEIIQTHNEIRPSGFTHVRTDAELDLLAITSATHYNDEAIEKCHAKMYVSKEDFLNQVEFYQFKRPNNYLEIPFMKLIYFYLIDRKRHATVNMDVIHRTEYYLREENDADSLTGRIIHLQSVCWLEITGRFEHKIMPGKYEVSWRIKCDINGKIWGETEYIVVPQHGKLLNYKMSADDFDNLVLEHQHHWFIIKMGQTIIYEPSIVLVAIRNWNNPNWKYGISWDFIELTIVP